MGIQYPVPLHHLAQPLLANPDRRRLCRQVSFALVGSAGVAADKLDDLVVEAPAAGQLQGRDDRAFLV